MKGIPQGPKGQDSCGTRGCYYLPIAGLTKIPKPSAEFGSLFFLLHLYLYLFLNAPQGM